MRQGGCASTMYFLICAETLAIELRNNPEIHGIPVGSFTDLLSQFADDMDIFLMHQENSLRQVISTLETFQKNSGFTVNYDKTQIYRIGSLRNSAAKLYVQKDLVWTNNTFAVLGIHVNADTNLSIALNYGDIVNKVQSILITWRSRNLSLVGKVLIVNTLIASLFVYKMMVLPSMPEKMIKDVEELIERFIWNNRRPKIPLRRLQNAKLQGGLELVDLRKKDLSLKVTWKKILEKDTQLANLVYSNIAPSLREDIWKCGLKTEHVAEVIDPEKNTFWYQVMIAWRKHQNPKNETTDFIWYNSEICIDGKPIFWQSAYEKGLKYARQLYESGRPHSVIHIQNTYGISWIQYNSLISALPTDLRQTLRSGEVVSTDMTCPTSRVLYKQLISNEKEMYKKHKDWEHEFGFAINFDMFLQGFKDIYVVTNVPKYRSFQFRLLHRAIITNVHLFRWKKRETNLCTFCEKNKESYLHLFVYCEKVEIIWKQLDEFMKKLNEEPTHFDVDTVMWNRIVPARPEHVNNFLCLVTKQYIYRQRCFGKIPSFQELLENIFLVKNIEKHIAAKNSKMIKFTQKWEPKR